MTGHDQIPFMSRCNLPSSDRLKPIMLDRVEMDEHQTSELVTYGSRLSEHDKEIGQGHDFHDFELIQNEYLRNLDMIDPMDEGSDAYLMKDYKTYARRTKN